MNCVSFNEDSSLVISGSVDTTVKIWDTRSRAQVSQSENTGPMNEPIRE